MVRSSYCTTEGFYAALIADQPTFTVMQSEFPSTVMLVLQRKSHIFANTNWRKLLISAWSVGQWTGMQTFTLTLYFLQRHFRVPALAWWQTGMSLHRLKLRAFFSLQRPLGTISWLLTERQITFISAEKWEIEIVLKLSDISTILLHTKQVCHNI